MSGCDSFISLFTLNVQETLSEGSNFAVNDIDGDAGKLFQSEKRTRVSLFLEGDPEKNVRVALVFISLQAKFQYKKSVKTQVGKFFF